MWPFSQTSLVEENKLLKEKIAKLEETVNVSTQMLNHLDDYVNDFNVIILSMLVQSNKDTVTIENGVIEAFINNNVVAKYEFDEENNCVVWAELVDDNDEDEIDEKECVQCGKCDKGCKNQ